MSRWRVTFMEPAACGRDRTESSACFPQLAVLSTLAHRAGSARLRLGSRSSEFLALRGSVYGSAHSCICAFLCHSGTTLLGAIVVPHGLQHLTRHIGTMWVGGILAPPGLALYESEWHNLAHIRLTNIQIL